MYRLKSKSGMPGEYIRLVYHHWGVPPMQLYRFNKWGAGEIWETTDLEVARRALEPMSDYAKASAERPVHIMDDLYIVKVTFTEEVVT